MQVYKVIPSNPNVIMVRNTLAVYGGLAVETRDIGTLCQAAGNKWAKFKPVNFPHPTALEAADIRVAYPNWYRGFNGACGLNILSYTTMSAMFTALRAGTFGWNYVKPTGGIGVQPFRIFDFIGYNVDAQPPAITNRLASTYFKNYMGMGVSINVMIPSEDELSLSDIGNSLNLGNCYFGAAVSKVGSSTYSYMTETMTIDGGGGGGVDFPINSLTAGDYDVALFFSTVSHGAPTSIDDGTYIPVFQLPIQRVRIEESDFGVYFGGGTYWDANKTYFEFGFANLSNTEKVLNGCILSIKYLDNIGDPDEVGETAFEVHTSGESDGVVRVPALTSVIISVDNPVSGITNPVLNSLPQFGTPYYRGGWISFINSTDAIYNTGMEIGAIE